MPWDDDLTEEQSGASSHIGSHARLLAGPGTGKTLCLIRRIIYLMTVHGVPATEILALTFTRAATAELGSRIRASLGDITEFPAVSTLHSFALRTILRFSRGLVLPVPVRVADDYEERWIILEDIKRMMNLPHIDDAKQLLQELSADWEQLHVDEEGYRSPNPEFRGIWEEHRAIHGYTLRAELVYQLKHALEAGHIPVNQGFRYLLVDEYQDLNPCDLSVIRLLTTDDVELYVAGDDDQSIYGFRYANPEGIRQFPINYAAQPIVLEECRRCDRRILGLALDVIRQDPRREAKVIRPRDDAGEGEVHILSFPTQQEEAEAIARICLGLVAHHGIEPENILILVRFDRNSIFSNPIIDALEYVGLRVARSVNPLQPLDDAEGRYFLSLLRLIHNIHDHLAWRCALAIRRNGIGEVTFNSIYELCHQRGVSFSEILQEIRNNPSIIGRGSIISDEVQAIENIVTTAIQNQEDMDLISFVRYLAEYIIENEELRTIVVNLFDSIIEETNTENLEQLLRVLNISVENGEQEIERGAINIMTMHQAKGLSADAVFVMAAEDEYIPGRAEGRFIDDERRLLYVSLTRARHFLYVTHCLRRTGSQRHSGSRAGSTIRTLTRFLRGGPIGTRPGAEYIATM